MMIRNLFVSTIGALIFSSCGSTASLWFTDKRMKEVTIGMDKTQVISIMGEFYLVNSSSKDTEGNLAEVLVYKSSSNEEYRLKFLNNRLESWNRVHLREYIQPETPPAASTTN